MKRYGYNMGDDRLERLSGGGTMPVCWRAETNITVVEKVETREINVGQEWGFNNYIKYYKK